MTFLGSVHGRTARPAGFARNMTKTVLQMLAMWAVFLFLLPAGVYVAEAWLGLASHRFRSGPAEAAGVVLFVGGWLLAEASAIALVRAGHGTPLPVDCPRRLVVVGPYRYVRNPMAMGSLAQGFAVGLWLGSPLVILYALLGTIGWNAVVRPWEEMDLERRFGEPYRRYRGAVRCWVPTLRPYRDARA